MQLPKTRTVRAVVPELRTAKEKPRRLVVILRTLSCVPVKPPTRPRPAGARSTPAPAGSMRAGQESATERCAPDGTENDLGPTCFSTRSAPAPLRARSATQATATRTLRAELPAGLPTWNAYAPAPDGRARRSATPGAAIETPPLAATYLLGQETVIALTAPADRPTRWKTVRASTTDASAEGAESTPAIASAAAARLPNVAPDPISTGRRIEL